MKYYSNRPYVMVDGVNYRVNVGPLNTKNLGKYYICTKQIKKIINQLLVMVNSYSRVLVVNLTMLMKSFTKNNKFMSEFRVEIDSELKKRYKFKK